MMPIAESLEPAGDASWASLSAGSLAAGQPVLALAALRDEEGLEGQLCSLRSSRRSLGGSPEGRRKAEAGGELGRAKGDGSSGSWADGRWDLSATALGEDGREHSASGKGKDSQDCALLRTCGCACWTTLAPRPGSSGDWRAAAAAADAAGRLDGSAPPPASRGAGANLT
mmetsp:Transcript_12281/g.33732  ORF Transcript_12281/g.33732 Transcript_12281/m.33732 type:complete len:170 (+) Transcript_12281:455-964(+)